MSVLVTNANEPQENWDDDYEFQPSASGSNTSPRSTRRKSSVLDGLPPLSRDTKNTINSWPSQASRTNGDSQDTPHESPPGTVLADSPTRSRRARRKPSVPAENWDDDFEDGEKRESPRKAKARMSLHQWAEPGPSTPSKTRRVMSTTDETENWDDDFQDGADSPTAGRKRYTTETSPRSKKGKRRPSLGQHENWDDDFAERGESWDSSEDDGEHSFGEREDTEDRTVTSRSRRFQFPHTPPPVPPLPMSLSLSNSPQILSTPRSPSSSVFSVPVSGRDSVAYSYSSTAPLALQPTLSGSSGNHPPTPPARPRERRRLRKKSRPAKIEAGIREIEQDRDESPPDVHPNPHADVVAPHEAAEQAHVQTSPPPSAGKSSLVSRIGSVGRKWGARRKRASTGPAEIAAMSSSPSSAAPISGGSRPVSMAFPSPPSSSKGWFFRQGGVHGAGSGAPPAEGTPGQEVLKHERSVDRLLALVGLDSQVLDTPSKRGVRARAKDKGRDNGKDVEVSVNVRALASGSEPDLSVVSSGRDADLDSESGHGHGAGAGAGHGYPQFSFLKRPASMQVPPPHRLRQHRHASYSQDLKEGRRSRTSSLARSASDSVDSLVRKRSIGTVRAEREDVKTPRGPRRSSDYARRISLSGKRPSGDRDRPRHSTSTTATATATARSIPDRGDDATPRPPSRIKGRPSMSVEVDLPLLPPIELQPPSPPRLAPSSSDPLTPLSHSADTRMPVLRPSQSSPLAMSATAPPAIARKTSTSPQSASLGRSTQAPKDLELVSGTLFRRNSLGDLKIPERISQAQMGLKRDLEFVRDFATRIDQLKDLQTSYHQLTTEMHAFLVDTVPPVQAIEEPKSRAVSPTFFGIPRPLSRARSNTNPNIVPPPSKEDTNHRNTVVAFRTIEAKYRLTWECADLLIELGGGPPAPDEPSSVSASLHPPTQSTSTSNGTSLEGRKSRDRAITLSGDESQPHRDIALSMQMQMQMQMMPNNTSHSTLPSASHTHWRASTGRHDLSHRQLMLLRDMLTSSDAATVLTTTIGVGAHEQIPEDEVKVDHGWRWGDAMNSTITLPTEESSQSQAESDAARSGQDSAAMKMKMQRRKSGRLGMKGLRDMLRSLKKSYSSSLGTSPSQEIQRGAASSSTSVSVSISTDCSSRPESVAQRRRAKTSPGPGERGSGSGRGRGEKATGFGTAGSLPHTHRASPRRPSLASIFRLGQRSRSVAKSLASFDADGGQNSHSKPESREPSAAGHEGDEADEEDWDRIESASDIDLTSRVDAMGTIRGRGTKGRSPYTYALHPNASASNSRITNPSRSSIWTVDLPPPQPSLFEAGFGGGGGPTPRKPSSTKLANVLEVAEREREKGKEPLRRTHSKASCGPSPSPKRPRSRASKLSIARSQYSGVGLGSEMMQPLVLAMTPENIRPLLENAKEVQGRCEECLAELRQLMDAHR